MTPFLIILSILAVAYLSAGAGVSLTLYTQHRAKLMGGPPTAFYLMTVPAWPVILRDIRRV